MDASWEKDVVLTQESTNEFPRVEANSRNAVGKLLQALDHWCRVEEEWDADRPIPMRPECAAGSCGVPHACPNEYDAAREHVLAALADPALAAWRGK